MKEAEVRPRSNAEAKHINFQLKIQENIICIYTKYGDSSNAERSMLKTIRAIRGKHSCINHMFDLGNTQKTFIAKTPKGVHQQNKPDATASWTDTSWSTSRVRKGHISQSRGSEDGRTEIGRSRAGELPEVHSHHKNNTVEAKERRDDCGSIILIGFKPSNWQLLFLDDHEW
jgi:hypothetical protein